MCLRWETSVANSVFDNMASNENVYVPPNFVKNVSPVFHIDSIDWLEDTPDGKNTSHFLIAGIFQRRICERAPFTLNCIIDSFGELLPSK